MDIKTYRFAIYLISFVFFLALGFFSGRMVSLNARAATLTSIPLNSTNDYPVPNTMIWENIKKDPTFEDLSSTGSPPIQQNLLIIGIDQMDSETPRLEGIWLVLYFSDSPHLTWMPIYPTFPAGNRAALQKDQELVVHFQLNQAGKPNNSFLEILHHRKLWWNGVVVLDRTALTYLFETIAKTKGNPAFADEYRKMLSILPPVEVYPVQALEAQTNILYSLCIEVSQFHTLPDLFSQADLITDHVAADFDLASFISQWQIRLAQGNRLICEFPFLSFQ